MKRTLFAAAAFAATLAIPAVAHAQMSSPIKFGVSAGATIPMSQNHLSDGVSTGYNLNGHLGFQAPMVPVGLRADVGYNKLGEKNSSGVDMSIFNGNLNAVINLGMAPVVSPYLIGGVGFYNTKFSGTNGGGSVSKTSVGFNGGLGLRFGLSGFSTFAEARYHYVSAKDATKGFENYSVVPISFGIMF